MYSTIVNYLLPNSQFSFNAQVLLLAFAVLTTLTENVSSEISNHIDEVTKNTTPKAGTTETASAVAMVVHKELEKSDILKSNDSEKNRLSRYLRTIPIRPPSSIGYRSMQARSTAAAAAAAAAAADEDLKHFGRISKYHAVPYDSRKYAAVTSPLRQVYGANTRYRYVKGDVMHSPASGANGKWRSHLSSTRYASSNDELPSSYEEDDDNESYYEEGQSDDHDREQEDTDTSWPYREIMQKERDIPVAFEDAEPALSMKHVVGKRGPFSNHHFELYAPHTIAHAAASGDVDLVDVAGGGGGIDGDRRYKKFTFNRGRDEVNLDSNAAAAEWFEDGGRRAVAGPSLKRNRLRGGGVGDRPKPSSFSPYKSQKPPKYSMFEAADENRHRFKFDNSARYPLRGANSMTGIRASVKQKERTNTLSYRGRNKKRNRDRDPNRYSSSMAVAAFNEDKEVSTDVADDNENEILTVAVRRRPSQQIQEDDVVYSSRYRNKQPSSNSLANENAPDTSQGIAADPNDVDSEADADEADPSRLLIDYHRSQRPSAARQTKKPKFGITNANRKSNQNGNGNDSDNDSDASSPFISSMENDDSAVDGNHSPKFNYKLSKPVPPSAFTSTPSSYFFPSSSSFPVAASVAASPSSHAKKTTSSSSSNHRQSSSSSTITDTNVTNPELYKFEFNQLKTRPSYVTADNANADSNFNSDPNENENEAEDSKSDSISASELIAYMSASPSEQRVVNKQDRFSKPSSTALLGFGHPFLRTFSEQHQRGYGHDQLESNFYQPALPAPFSDQDFEINLD